MSFGIWAIVFLIYGFTAITITLCSLYVIWNVAGAIKFNNGIKKKAESRMNDNTVETNYTLLENDDN